MKMFSYCVGISQPEPPEMCHPSSPSLKEGSIGRHFDDVMTFISVSLTAIDASDAGTAQF